MPDEPQQETQNGAQRELTYGEKLVGVKFNPAGSGRVDRLKNLYAAVIDEIRANRKSYEEAGDEVGVHLAQVAEDAALAAQMSSVKSATWGL